MPRAHLLDAVALEQSRLGQQDIGKLGGFVINVGNINDKGNFAQSSNGFVGV